MPLIPERHHSLLFTVKNLWSNILNLQTGSLSGISNPISPIFNRRKFMVLFLVFMHGLNFTETEEAPFIKANIFQFENEKVLEKNHFM